MSDAECGREKCSLLEHLRRPLVAGISQADPFERKAPEPAGGLSFDPSLCDSPYCKGSRSELDSETILELE